MRRSTAWTNRFARSLQSVPSARSMRLAALTPKSFPVSRWNHWRACLSLSRTTLRFVIFEPLADRSEEHTSELQSRRDLVCRLLLEKKKKNDKHQTLLET